MTRFNKIDSYVKQKKEFINSVRDILNKTPDESERMRRMSVFNTLLLVATYANPDELENELKNCFAEYDVKDQKTINYISDGLRDLNYLCVTVLNDNNINQQNSRRINSFFIPESEVNVELSQALKEMVFAKTRHNPEISHSCMEP
ncbi:Uncharacterised protein [Legionella busanensis]|uniref:Uncharacterized protein n=1 Tax=Legionella busanensis TaxID=190655 RepID=A0A378JG04_9GAMM|nr:hypothetical protein [Legionella busanensis]STX50206.1 Uncharacterised protein [Legionella busanensis]